MAGIFGSSAALGYAYVRNAAASALGMALGTLLGGLPEVWAGALHPAANAYRPIFLLISISALLAIHFLLSMLEKRH